MVEKTNTHQHQFFSIWMDACVITHILRYAEDNLNSDYWKQVNNVIKYYFMDYLQMKWLLLKTYFEMSTLSLKKRMVHLMVMNLFGKENTLDMVTVICGIKHIHFLHQGSWFWSM